MIEKNQEQKNAIVSLEENLQQEIRKSEDQKREQLHLNKTLQTVMEHLEGLKSEADRVKKQSLYMKENHRNTVDALEGEIRKKDYDYKLQLDEVNKSFTDDKQSLENALRENNIAIEELQLQSQAYRTQIENMSKSSQSSKLKVKEINDIQSALEEINKKLQSKEDEIEKNELDSIRKLHSKEKELELSKQQVKELQDEKRKMENDLTSTLNTTEEDLKFQEEVIKQLRAELTSANTELQNVSKNINREFADLKSELCKTKEDMKRKEDRIKMIQSDLSLSNKKMRQREDEKRTLKDELNTQVVNMKKLQQNLEDSRIKINTLNDEVKCKELVLEAPRSNEEGENLKVDHNIMQDKTTPVGELHAKIRTLQNKLNTKETYTKQIQSELTATKETIRLKDDFINDITAHHQIKLHDKDEEMKKIQSQVDVSKLGGTESNFSFERRIHLIAPTVDELQKQAKDYRKRIEEFSKQLIVSENDETVKQKKKIQQELKPELVAAKEKLQEKEDEIMKMSYDYFVQLCSVEKELDRAKKELKNVKEETKSKRDNLSSRLNNVETDLTSQEETIDYLNKELARTKKEFKKIMNEKRKLDRENNKQELTKKINHWENKIQESTGIEN